MADIEKHAQSNADRSSSGGLPEHLEEMKHVHTEIDVIHTTTENPYKEINFIGTYLAIGFATCGAFAGFVMPVTSLTIINMDIGTMTASPTTI